MKYFTFLLALFSGIVLADCPQLYPNKTVIDVPDTVELCNSFYVARYNSKINANIISAEVLQPSGHQVERSNDFHADKRVSPSIGPSEYAHSGYDKGHMVPASDATSAAEMTETFLMTNMTPQSPQLNRIKWRMLEEKVRGIAAKSQEPIYVVTGAIYPKNYSKMKRVPIPSAYYKVVYANNSTVAFYAENIDNADVVQISVHDIAQRSGLKF